MREPDILVDLARKADRSLKSARVKADAKDLGRKPTDKEAALADLTRALSKERSEKARAREIAEDLRRKVEELMAVQNFLDLEPDPRRGLEAMASPGKGTGRNREAVACAIASDWHVEETVTSEQSGGVNEMNLRIAEERIARYFRKLVLLTEMSGGGRHGARISRLVVGLIGDIINGYLRDENLIGNSLTPPEAIVWAWERISQGLEYVLAHTTLKQVLVVCRSGNHGRFMGLSSRQIMWSHKEEMSLEHVLYKMLAQRFQGNRRISFMVPSAGIYSDVDILGFKYRFFHGDNVRFMGGVGGLSIPLNKLILRWNQRSKAYMHCLGHFHSTHWLPNANVNGCFTPDTRVLTIDGPVPIEKVQTGMTVLSHDGTFQTVEATTRQTTRDIIKLRAKGLPNFVRTTPNHEFWAIKGESSKEQRGRSTAGHHPTVINERPQWIRAEFLSEGDWICTPSLKGTEERDRDLLWAYGLFMAEGHTILDGGASKRHNRIEFSMHLEERDEYLGRAKRILDKELGQEGRAWTRPNRTTSHLSYSGREIALHFRNEFGHTAQGKKIPAWMFGLSPGARAEIVRGWIDGDGHYGRQTSAASVSENLAWGMWLLSVGTEWEPMLYQSVSRSAAAAKGRAEAWCVSFVGKQDVRWVGGERFVRIDYRGREIHDEPVTVHDIQVSGEHTYCVEGMGVHNSLIGYDSYALAMGFDFEPPQQSYWIVRNGRGQDERKAIFLDRD